MTFIDAVAFPNAHFGAGSGTIHSSDYGCTGTENRLLDCPTSPTACSSHSDDAGVRCQGTKISSDRIV